MAGCDLVGLFFPGRNLDIGCLVVGPNRNHNDRGTLLRRMSLLGRVGAGVSISVLLTMTSLSLVRREVPLGLEEYTIC